LKISTPFITVIISTKPTDFSGFNHYSSGASPGGDRFEGGFCFP